MIINGKAVPWRTLDDLLKDKHALHGDQVFADIDGKTLTYADLDRRTRRLASALIGTGLQPGDRVATFLLNAPEQILVWFACVRAGVVWVPLNGGLEGDDLRYTLTNCGARALFLDVDCALKFEAVRGAFPDVALYSVGALTLSDATPFARLEEDARECELPVTHPWDAGAILYTGGTTGLPKGVVLPQFSFILAGVRYGESFSVRAGERHFSTMPLFHAGALQWGIMGPLVNDMTCVIDKRFSASRYFDRLRETGANVIDPLGVVMTMLCNQPAVPADRSHSVRIALGATHGLPEHIPGEFTRRFGIPLVMVYGITEGGGSLLTTNRRGADLSNGSAHGWIEASVIDPEGFQVEPGVTGRLLIRPMYPYMFMTEYFGDPTRTAEVYRDCWLHTGDLASLDATGNLTFVGREAHWLRRRGENISAVEVETILVQYPGVREVAVVAAPSELGEDEVKAFVVPEIPDGIDPASLCTWCAGRMAAFKVPRFIQFIDRLPRSAAKMEVDRGALRRLPNTAAYDRTAEV